MTNIRLAYTVASLAGAATFTSPVNNVGVAAWLQFSYPPLNMFATAYPVVYERRYVRGFVDADQAGTLNILISDDGATTRATIAFAIPLNAVGQATAFAVTLPGGKYVSLTYVNGAAAQARFCLLANLCYD